MTTANLIQGDKPTAQSLRENTEHLTRVWNDSREKWIKADRYYERRYDVWKNLPEGTKRPSWHIATPTAIVDKAVATQLAFKPSARRRSVGGKQEKAEWDDEVETWVVQCLNQAAEYETELQFKLLARHFIMYGYGILKGPIIDYSDQPIDPKKWNDEEEPRRGETDKEFEKRGKQNKSAWNNWFPFRLQTPHPARILLDPNEKRPTFGIERVAHYRRDLHLITKQRAELFEGVNVFPLEDHDPWEIIPTTEWWDFNYQAMSVDTGDSMSMDKDLLFALNNEWGIVPYKHGFAGFGGEPTEMERIDPKHRAKSLLETTYETIDRESQRVSGQHNLMLRIAWAKIAAGQNLTPAEIRIAMQGDIVPLDPSEIGYITSPEVRDWFFRMGDEARDEIESVTFTQDVAGQRQAGVDTVGQQMILREASLNMFSGTSAQMDHIVTHASEDLLRLVDNVLERPIRVRGAEIGPREIDGDYQIHVQFERIDPVRQMQEADRALTWFQAGALDLDTLLAKGGYEDATAIHKGLVKDRVRAMPEYTKKITLETMRELGMHDLADDMEKMSAEDVQQALITQPAGGERSLVDLIGTAATEGGTGAPLGGRMGGGGGMGGGMGGGEGGMGMGGGGAPSPNGVPGA